MADIFDVIADGTRREILDLLRSRTPEGSDGTSVSQIVVALGVSQPTVSKHLKVLREAGLVSVREEGQHRFYSLSPEPLGAVDDWVFPFLLDEAEGDGLAVPSLPEQAAFAAETVGRVAASATHAVQSAIKRFGA